MAIKGVTIPVVGKYTNTNGTVTYTDGLVASKAVEYSIELETGDNNPDYQDNEIAENDKTQFAGGTLGLTLGDIEAELSKYLLGTKTVTDTWQEGTESKTASVEVFDDEATAPYLGFGIIETHQINDVTKYKANILCKVQFGVPADSAETKGNSIDWQHPELEAQIMRSDEVSTNYVHPWKKSAWFTAEGDAFAWLKHSLGFEEPEDPEEDIES